MQNTKQVLLGIGVNKTTSFMSKMMGWGCLAIAATISDSPESAMSWGLIFISISWAIDSQVLSTIIDKKLDAIMKVLVD